MDRLAAFATWLGHSPVSALVTSRSAIVPGLQVVHIVAIAAVVISAVQIDLRALRLHGAHQPLSVYLDRFLPVIAVALAVLALTGFLLIASEPDRTLFRTVFWVKLALIVVAAALTWSLRLRPLAGAGDDAVARGTRIVRSLVAIASLATWVGVIFAGRWIAYALAWPGAPG